MPPSYAWKCESCGKEIEKTVPMDHSAEPPEEQKDTDCTYHLWKRDYHGQLFSKKYGDGWGYRKGKGYNN